MKRKVVALLVLSYRCIVTINVLWLFLMVPWVGLLYVIVVFPDHTHLLFAVKDFSMNVYCINAPTDLIVNEKQIPRF